MSKKFYLCGVEISKYRYQKRSVKSALIALDINMKDWVSVVENNENYCQSRRCLIELCEICGELKFMYMSGIISSDEYRQIGDALVDKNMEEIDANDIE